MRWNATPFLKVAGTGKIQKIVLFATHDMDIVVQCGES